MIDEMNTQGGDMGDSQDQSMDNKEEQQAAGSENAAPEAGQEDQAGADEAAA